MAHTSLPLERCLEILRRVQVGRLATCRDGEPYVVPLSFVYHRDRVYFHCACHGRKLDNIAANPRVCFQVDDEATILPGPRACNFTAHYFSAMVAGRARVVSDPDLRLDALRALAAKYDPEGMAPMLTQEDLDKQAVLVIEIMPEAITGVDHSRLPAK